MKSEAWFGATVGRPQSLFVLQKNLTPWGDWVGHWSGIYLGATTLSYYLCLHSTTLNCNWLFNLILKGTTQSCTGRSWRTNSFSGYYSEHPLLERYNLMLLLWAIPCVYILQLLDATTAQAINQRNYSISFKASTQIYRWEFKLRSKAQLRDTTWDFILKILLVTSHKETLRCKKAKKPLIDGKFLRMDLRTHSLLDV